MPKSNETATPTDDAIAQRAYELYLQRGSVSGHELDDWLADLRSAGLNIDRSPDHPAGQLEARRAAFERYADRLIREAVAIPLVECPPLRLAQGLGAHPLPKRPKSKDRLQPIRVADLSDRAVELGWRDVGPRSPNAIGHGGVGPQPNPRRVGALEDRPEIVDRTKLGTWLDCQ